MVCGCWVLSSVRSVSHNDLDPDPEPGRRVDWQRFNGGGLVKAEIRKWG